ncbi:1-phosphofructokinase family hexose kinase [Flavobacterium sp.]|uniref:1-phosphofructokinase family hexose kinase n=1 Tax=Flavobacterium sp. TaxID=239 RepID=UPI0037533B5C
MSKIITITFNPSIDKSASISAMQPDIKMHCSAANIEPGGGGINVARVISRLGGDVKAIFPSGGYTGMFFNHLLENEKVPFVSIQSKNETRENFVILDESTNKQFRFGMPSNEIFENEWKDCLKTIENSKDVDYIIASGSLPPGIPNDIYAKLSKTAKSNNAKFIVDTSGEALKQAVREGVYLLKPNLEELAILLDIKDLKIENVENVAKELIQKNNCEIILVSLGAYGAMLITKDESYTIKPPKVKVKSTVGAGDSMVAGIVFGLSNNLSLQECLQYGIACGTATTMNLGSALCEKKDVEKLLKLLKK